MTGENEVISPFQISRGNPSISKSALASRIPKYIPVFEREWGDPRRWLTFPGLILHTNSQESGKDDGHRSFLIGKTPPYNAEDVTPLDLTKVATTARSAPWFEPREKKYLNTL